MSKQYNIRWSEADNQELARSVRNFNAKVKRLEEKYKGSDVIIPERVSVKEMRELVNTRRDLQRELKSLQRFTERGSEKVITVPNTDNNIQLTKWQKEEMSKRAGVINRKRTLRRKEHESKELENQGKSLGYTRGDIGMGKVEFNQLRPTSSFTKKMTKADVKAKFEHFMRESQSDYWNKRDILMRENFIKALEENFNPKDIKDVIENIRNMDIKDFKDKLLSNPEDFNTAYPPDEEQYQGYLTQLKSTWTPTGNPKGSTKKKSKKKSKKRAGKK